MTDLREYPPDGAFTGHIGRTLEESIPAYPSPLRAPDGAPNVVYVVLDDVGFAQLGCFGSDIDTPAFDRLAERGVRYRNFHTTAMCSPTRASLLTGCNHHTTGMGGISDQGSGFPGYHARITKRTGFLSEILRDHGYASLAVGKWHLAPREEQGLGSTRQRWPLGRGFERFYGFLGAETNQWDPDLIHDNHAIEPPATADEGYHLTEDLAVLDLIGIDAPNQIDGVAQEPLAGTSLTSTLHDPEAGEVRRRQYYELLGCRAIYQDGWKAVAYHPFIGQHYDKTSDPFQHFDDDEWELSESYASPYRFTGTLHRVVVAAEGEVSEIGEHDWEASVRAQ